MGLIINVTQNPSAGVTFPFVKGVCYLNNSLVCVVAVFISMRLLCTTLHNVAYSVELNAN